MPGQYHGFSYGTLRSGGDMNMQTIDPKHFRSVSQAANLRVWTLLTYRSCRASLRQEQRATSL